VTHPGQVIRIQSEGMPMKDVPSQFGDLYVVVSVDFPDRLSEEDRVKLASVRSLGQYTGKVRSHDEF